MTEEERKLLEEVHGDLYEDFIRVHPMRTVCEVLREVYWGIENEDMRLKIKEAMMLSKKMSRRLTYYWKQSNPDKSDPTHNKLFKVNPFSEQARKELEKKRLKQAVEEASENNRVNVR